MEATTGLPQFHVQPVRSPESKILVGSQNPLDSGDGFKLDKKGGQTVLSLSKLADIPIRLHRDIPDNAALKQVTLTKEPTGEWFATFGVEMDHEPPSKPDNPEQCVGIDVGICKYAHDSDGTAVESLDLSIERERLERERLEREQWRLSRKQHGSANYERQRKRVAQCHADLKYKRRDFLHKLSNYYATEYDLVAVEDLNVRGMLESPSNSRNTAAAAWRTFLSMLEYKCEREGTHYVPVDPKDTTKECSQCGVKTDKPLWVREHSCPACGFTADRDLNAVARLHLAGSQNARVLATAYNILFRGLRKIGVVHSESTPAETALPVDTPVSAKHVIETGSPTLNETASAAE